MTGDQSPGTICDFLQNLAYCKFSLLLKYFSFRRNRNDPVDSLIGPIRGMSEKCHQKCRSYFRSFEKAANAVVTQNHIAYKQSITGTPYSNIIVKQKKFKKHLKENLRCYPSQAGLKKREEIHYYKLEVGILDKLVGFPYYISQSYNLPIIFVLIDVINSGLESFYLPVSPGLNFRGFARVWLNVEPPFVNGYI